jgi:zinc protease
MIRPDTVVRNTLGNGLTILVRKDSAAPVVAVVTYVKAGYFDENDDVVGVSHVLEHMFFKGTPSRGVGEIARQTKASGGYLNAHTIYDHTSYFAVLPKDGFARGLEIQADAFARSLIDAAELQKELEVIIQEAKRKADSPSAVTVETLYELLHDRHRIRRWRIGREHGLRELSRDDVFTFYRDFYRPGNTILSIAGDVDVGETLDRVESLYGMLEAGTVARDRGPHEVALPGFRYREIEGDLKQSQVAIGWRTPGILHPDTVAMDLFSAILGMGRGSRLYRGVRDRQLASSVSADNYTPADIGVLVMHAEGPPVHARHAAVAMWKELFSALGDGVRPEEVQRVQRLFESRWLRRLETMEGQANFLAEWEALGDWRWSERYFAQVMAASADAIVGTARRYCVSDQASVLVYRPIDAPPFAAGADEARAHLEARGAPASVRDEDNGTASFTLPTPLALGAPRSGLVDLERIDGQVFVFRTRRGMPILVRQRRGAPIVHMGVFAGAGAAWEPDAVAGLATVTARTMLKGTGRRTAQQIAYASELLGGSIAPSVTADGLGWSFSVPRPRLDEAVELLADVVQHPSFDEGALETERAIALANLAELRDDMYRYPLRLATGAAYEGHPYGRGLLGSEETLRALGTDDARRWHDERVVHSSIVLGIVGDVEDRDAAMLLANAFDELTPTSTQPVPPPAWPLHVVEVVEPRERAQTAMAMGFRGPTRRDGDRFASQLIAAVASGLGGRFFEALRDKRSLAYTVQAYGAERASAGAFMAYIATSPEQEEAARDGLLAEFERLRAAPVSAEELERAKVFTLGTHAIAQQNGGTVLAEMIDAWLFGEGLDELEQFETRIRGVTAERMQDVALRYFDPTRRVEGIVRGKKNGA